MEESPISQLCFLLMMYSSMQLFVQYIVQTPVQYGSLAIIREPIHYSDSPSKNNNKVNIRGNAYQRDLVLNLTNFLEHLFEFVLVWRDVHSLKWRNSKLLYFNNNLKVTTIRISGDYIWMKLNIFVFFAVKLSFFSTEAK